MKLFIDSAEIKEIEAAAKTGLVDGVTTNPSLVAKSGQKFETLLQRICELVDGPISAEVTATDTDGMVKQGRELAKIHRNIIIKLPLTIDGLRAAQVFKKEGTKTNVTLCFSPAQALMAAKAGASFVSPFVGRLDDMGHDGMSLIEEINTIYKNYGFKTEILVASVRHPEHVVRAAKIGADVCTLPYKIFAQLFNHALTDIGLEKFLKDWENAKK